MNQFKCCLLLGVCLGLGLFFPAQAHEPVPLG